MQCKTCRWFDNVHGYRGTCRFAPPPSNNAYGEAYWPGVAFNDWCAQWTYAPERDATEEKK